MASLRGGVRVALGLRALGRPVAVQARRHASQQAAKDNTTWLIAGGAGIAAITAFSIYAVTARRPSATKMGIQSKRVAEYAKTDAVHPEAEAEQLISAQSEKTTPTAPPPTKPQEPVEVRPLPSHVPYVLVGAGTASFAAAKAIREKDPSAKVLIIGEEDYTPYSRPPLSKQLWLYEDHNATKELKFKASWSGDKLVDPFYKADFCSPYELMEREEGGLAVLTATKAVGLQPSEKKLTLSNGSELTYDKCLLATGGRPRNLSLFQKGAKGVRDHSTVYRTIPDYLTLDKLVGSVGSILVVGGGFLGSELAVGLASRGKEKGLQVTQVFPEGGNLGLVLPKELAQWTTEKVRKEGVFVYPGSELATAAYEGGKVKVATRDGKEFEVDHVVVAVGLEPNTDLAKSARLETDPILGGYRVNAELQACTDVWAAGDVACFFDPYLGRRRVEHHDHANVSGRLAGGNMAGGNQRFTHQSMFWSDVGPDVGFEATGLIDRKLPTVGIWAKSTEEAPTTEEAPKTEESPKTEDVEKTAEPAAPGDDYSKGVVFYLSPKDRRVVGVLTWNLFGKMDLARKVIAAERKEADIGEIATQFDVHQSTDSQ